MTWTSEIAALSGLVAHWPMREPSGTTLDNAEGTAARDATLSGSGYTMGVSGPILSDGASSTGITFSAAGLSGANAANNTGWNVGTNSFTLGCWLNLTASWPGTSQFLLGRGSPDLGTGFEMMLAGGASNTFSSRLNAVTINSGSGTTISGTGWHFVVLVMDRAGNGQWYLDGSAYGSGTSISTESGTNITGSNSLYLGRRSAGNYLDASMAELFICTSALSSGTISSLYSTAITTAGFTAYARPAQAYASAPGKS